MTGFDYGLWVSSRDWWMGLFCGILLATLLDLAVLVWWRVIRIESYSDHSQAGGE